MLNVSSSNNPLIAYGRENQKIGGFRQAPRLCIFVFEYEKTFDDCANEHIISFSFLRFACLLIRRFKGECSYDVPKFKYTTQPFFFSSNNSIAKISLYALSRPILNFGGYMSFESSLKFLKTRSFCLCLMKIASFDALVRTVKKI